VPNLINGVSYGLGVVPIPHAVLKGESDVLAGSLVNIFDPNVSLSEQVVKSGARKLICGGWVTGCPGIPVTCSDHAADRIGNWYA
jgi:hypothetical protein